MWWRSCRSFRRMTTTLPGEGYRETPVSVLLRVEGVERRLHACLELTLLARVPPVVDVEAGRQDPDEADRDEDREHRCQVSAARARRSIPRTRDCQWPRPLGRGHRLPSTQSAGRAVTCTETFPLSHDARRATMPVVEPFFDLYETSESPRSFSSSEKRTWYCASAKRSLYSL